MSFDDEDSISLSSGSSTSLSHDAPELSSEFIDMELQESEAAPKIAEKENRRVNMYRALVILVLVCATAAVATLTYVLTSNEEDEDFRTKFFNDANEIITVANQKAENIFGVVNVLSVLFTSSAGQSELDWPTYSLPDFEAFGSGSRELSGALMIAFTPFVSDAARQGWEDWSVDNQEWLQEGYDYLDYDTQPENITEYIYRRTSRAVVPEPPVTGPYSPVWQISPAPLDTAIVNFNLFNHHAYRRLVRYSVLTKQAAISEILDTSLVFGESAPQKVDGNPQSILVTPVFKEIDNKNEIVGTVVAVISWQTFFQNLLPDGENGLFAVLKTTCNETFTYMINGDEAIFLGEGDHHETTYDDMVMEKPFAAHKDDLDGVFGDLDDHCQYTAFIYPSSILEDSTSSNEPLIYTLAVVLIFAFTSMVFFVYDCKVRSRQRAVLGHANRTNKIVSSMFPAFARDKILSDNSGGEEGTKGRLNTFLKTGTLNDSEADSSGNRFASDPIADLFPHCTVMFADIAGFTAWSSTREPSQVFILLESLYHEFDLLAKQRRVFKVETIGDCYVACAGLPEPRADHALAMTRFARDCCERFNVVVHELEKTLGPDTCDLDIRFGLHSGPVTAGVLRGDNCRFQLFGDTVNTAARMESNGLPSRIHVSQETADLLVAGGKQHWITQREDKIKAKGKGLLQTYWVGTQGSGTAVSSSEYNSSLSDSQLIRNNSMQMSPKLVESPRVHRLIDWNCEVLGSFLKPLVAKRLTQASKKTRSSSLNSFVVKGGSVLGEVVEIIELPELDEKIPFKKTEEVVPELDPAVASQLREYVTAVSALYDSSNPFHNFEHASHVSMSACKLLHRIVNNAQETSKTPSEFYHKSCGLAADPLAQFAIVFSALVHDAHHPGVPNFVLVNEKSELAGVYQNRAVAEQNSIELAWDTLMDPRFKDLRDAIFPTIEEMKRFRQLVVNSVIATDIFDSGLSASRKSRWEKAFSESATQPDNFERKATIVIEHLIQASDIAHTMQHWHVYQKWNERLFHEMYRAFEAGRLDSNPLKGWYEGELKFFDGYVIPLAKKLQQCQVFGVSSDEYLNYALENRNEWEEKGQDVVTSFAKKYGSLQTERLSL